MDDAFALEQFLPFRIAILGNRLTRMMARTNRSLGLSGPGWRIIALLGQHGAMPLREVMPRVAMDKVRLSRVVRSLHDAGVINRLFVSDDRRRSTLELTEGGQELYRQLAELGLALQLDLLATLAPEERAALDRALGAIETHCAGRVRGSQVREDRAMARVLIKCPVLGRSIPTGLEVDAESWETRQLGDNRAFCPACKQTHTWTKSDAWLEHE